MSRDAVPMLFHASRATAERSPMTVHSLIACTTLGAHLLCTTVASPAASSKPANVAPTSPARLEPGADGVATAKGSIAGYDGRDLLIRVGAGQVLVVEMETGKGSAYFNVMPPLSKSEAMFIGSTSGSRFRGTAPIAGDYLVRVYQMRSAARRNEVSTFRLTTRISGKALVPLASATDARISGTSFHARTTVACAIPYEPEVKECQASVIRYGHDGTATVELQSPSGFVRRILFEQGRPVACDATEALTFERTGERTTVRVGDEERFEIPDALLTGG